MVGPWFRRLHFKLCRSQYHNSSTIFLRNRANEDRHPHVRIGNRGRDGNGTGYTTTEIYYAMELPENAYAGEYNAWLHIHWLRFNSLIL